MLRSLDQSKPFPPITALVLIELSANYSGELMTPPWMDVFHSVTSIS